MEKYQHANEHEHIPSKQVQLSTSSEVKTTNLSRKNDIAMTKKSKLDSKMIPSESHFIPIQQNLDHAEPKNPSNNIDINTASMPLSMSTIRVPPRISKGQPSSDSYLHPTQKEVQRSNIAKRKIEQPSKTSKVDLPKIHHSSTEHISKTISEKDQTRTSLHRRHVGPKTNENITNASQFNLDDTSSLHNTIKCKKDSIKELMSDDNLLNTVLSKLPETDASLSSSLAKSALLNLNTLDIDKPLSETNEQCGNGHVYERNSFSGQFLKRNIPISRKSNQYSDNNESPELIRYTSVMDFIYRSSRVAFSFTNGVLAGFSIHTLFNLPITDEDMQMFVLSYSGYCTGIIRFYFLSISFCLTGIAVKRRPSRKYRTSSPSTLLCNNDSGVILDQILLLFYFVALVLTLSNAKIELNLRQYPRMNNIDPKWIVEKVGTWKKLSVIRSIVCIIQWFISCWDIVSQS